MKNLNLKNRLIGGNSHSLEGVAVASATDGVVVLKKLLTLPYNPKLKETARKLRKAGNLAEVLLWQQIKNKKLGFDFDRQRIIGNYIVDFYCHSKKIIIEVDGSSHDNKQEYDEVRDKYLENCNLQILHVTDKDVKENMDAVLNKINNNLK